MSTIFWTIFGLIDEDSFQIDVSGYGAIWKTGMTLFAAYNIIIVIVAINMLIAILNESYTRITVRCHLKCRNYPVTESVENFHAITDQASELFALTIIFFADICKHIMKT